MILSSYNNVKNQTNRPLPSLWRVIYALILIQKIPSSRSRTSDLRMPVYYTPLQSSALPTELSKVVNKIEAALQYISTSLSESENVRLAPQGSARLYRSFIKEPSLYYK